jgi:hypothetical protein
MLKNSWGFDMQIHFGNLGQYNPALTAEDHGIDSNRAHAAEQLGLPAGTWLHPDLLVLAADMQRGVIDQEQAHKLAAELTAMKNPNSDQPKQSRLMTWLSNLLPNRQR